MDFQYYGPNNPYQQPWQDKRSASMATAAMILGIISLVTCTCLYISVICGGLAILLALLSKGGELTLSRNAKLALGLGIAGLCTTVVLYAISFAMIIGEYGSLEAYLKAYLQDYGMSLEDLMGEMY
jgi:predicted histidine transporter YuiF (NhaC family)